MRAPTQSRWRGGGTFLPLPTAFTLAPPSSFPSLLPSYCPAQPPPRRLSPHFHPSPSCVLFGEAPRRPSSPPSMPSLFALSPAPARSISRRRGELGGGGRGRIETGPSPQPRRHEPLDLLPPLPPFPRPRFLLRPSIPHPPLAVLVSSRGRPGYDLFSSLHPSALPLLAFRCA